MRILHLYKAYPPVRGGIENTVELLAEAQAAAGHAVTVLVSAPGLRTVRERIRGVDVVRVGRVAEVASTPLSPALPLHVLSRGAVLAHVHSPFPPAEVANLLFGRARRTVLTYHSDVVRQQRILQLYRPLLEAVLRRADAIFPTSEAYVRRSPFLAPVADRCRVIPLGLRLDRFRPRQPEAALRLRTRWLGPDTDRPLVLFVGRLRAYKGLPYLIDAMARVDATAVIGGTGPEKAALRDQIAARGLGSRVRLVGEVTDADLPAAYQAADVFVLPSHQPSEAFGLVLIEAMASGCPVISTELGTGTSVVNPHGVTGLVVPPADPGALAAALTTLLGDPDRRQRMGEAGRRRADAEYSAEVYVARTMSAYEEVLAR